VYLTGTESDDEDELPPGFMARPAFRTLAYLVCVLSCACLQDFDEDEDEDESEEDDEDDGPGAGALTNAQMRAMISSQVRPGASLGELDNEEDEDEFDDGSFRCSNSMIESHMLARRGGGRGGTCRQAAAAQGCQGGQGGRPAAGGQGCAQVRRQGARQAGGG
jgi:hypothetical protein